MSQWTVALASQGHKYLPELGDAMKLGVADIKEVYPLVNPQTLALAQQLTLQLPEFTWTIDVDIAGRHRVTIHFKGAEIALDE